MPEPVNDNPQAIPVPEGAIVGNGSAQPSQPGTTATAVPVPEGSIVGAAPPSTSGAEGQQQPSLLKDTLHGKGLISDTINFLSGMRPNVDKPGMVDPSSLLTRWKHAYSSSGAEGMVNLSAASATRPIELYHEAVEAYKKGDWKTASFKASQMISDYVTPGLIDPKHPMVQAAARLITQPVEDAVGAYQEGVKTIHAIHQQDYKSAADHSREMGKHVTNVQVPVVGPAVNDLLDHVGTDIKEKNWDALMGDVGGFAGSLLAPEAIEGMVGARGASMAGRTVSRVAETGTLAETAEHGLPLKPAGERVLNTVEQARKLAGEDASYWREGAEGTLKVDKLPFRKGDAASKMAQNILDNEPVSSELKPLLQKYADAKPPKAAEGSAAQPAGFTAPATSGNTTAAESLEMTPQQVRQEMMELDNRIDSLQAQADAGHNVGTQLGQTKRLKSAISENRYDLLEEFGDPTLAQQARASGRYYAQFIDNIRNGPARDLLGTDKPEIIVKRVISQGAGAQSAVESMFKDVPSDARAAFGQDVAREIQRQSALPGNAGLSAAKIATKFRNLGDTATAIYGADKAQAMQKLYDVASRVEFEKNAIAEAKQTGRTRAVRAGITGTASTVGGLAGGVPGAVIGATVANQIEGKLAPTLKIGKIGQMKVGILPNEVITVAPAIDSAIDIERAAQRLADQLRRARPYLAGGMAVQGQQKRKTAQQVYGATGDSLGR